MQKIIPILVEKPITEKVEDTSNSKDWAMVKTMASLARKAPQSNLTSLEINNITRKTRLALLILPEWGVYFPPYNVSRLSAVARSSGYGVTVHDINIEAWHRIRDKMDYDPWDPSREFLWEQADTYFKELHPHCEPVFNEFIDSIVASNPDVIGFTLYYTNEQCSNWMAQKFRERLPNVKIICGGPQTNSLKRDSDRNYDHIVQGEGEQLLLKILDSIENCEPIKDKYLIQPKTERLDLDSMPFPDYTDYDFNKYTTPNGTSSEISRGCVAKCVFCTEVHFWKYRGRRAGSILDEMEYQVKTHGIDFIWFIDSLVNGNLKEIRAFALGIVERKIKLRWQGYARCDTRMDPDYFKDLAASGCHMLNYGIESGSQRVLNAMKKNITRESIESNLRDGGSVGILNSSNWITGFPSEDAQDFADTLTIVYRIRNYRLLNISAGVSMMLSPGAEITDNSAKFNIHPMNFERAWTTNDFSNTKLHRLIRQKSFQMFCQHLNPKEYVWGCERNTLLKMYDLEYDLTNVRDTIPYEIFDYQIIKPGISNFVDTVVNEIWPLLRNYWRALGPYKVEIRYSPEEDLKEWGFRLACDYTATYQFEIDASGHWHADFDCKFVQNRDQGWYQVGTEHHRVHWAQDLSFTHQWQGQGDWS